MMDESKSVEKAAERFAERFRTTKEEIGRFIVGQDEIDEDIFSTIAKDLKLDVKKFDKCLDSGTHADEVEADLQYGVELGVTGTPGSFLNGVALGGALPYADLKSLIEELL